VLAWLSVWSETCMWPSWCHCHSLSLASVKSRLVLLFWYRLSRVVPEKGLLNLCVCVCARARAWEWELSLLTYVLEGLDGPFADKHVGTTAKVCEEWFVKLYGKPQHPKPISWRGENGHTCAVHLSTVGHFIFHFIFCWHHSLKLSSEIKVWDLINMQNVLNHVSDRLIVSSNWRMQGKFLAFGPWWLLYQSKLQCHLWHICFPCICLSKSWSDLFWYLGLMPPKV